MKAITSRVRGWNATTKSSSPIWPGPRSSVRERSHGYWLCNTIAQRMSASSSGTSSVASKMSSVVNTGKSGSYPGMTKVSASGWARNSATVGLIGGSSVAW